MILDMLPLILFALLCFSLGVLSGVWYAIRMEQR